MVQKSSSRHTLNCNGSRNGRSQSSQADKNKEISFVPLQDAYQV